MLKFESNHSGIETQNRQDFTVRMSKFESNHSGIETIFPKDLYYHLEQFESNHSGIETESVKRDFIEDIDLNRTIVELRPVVTA